MANLQSPGIILKIRPRDSLFGEGAKGEISKEPCVRRATFRSVQASSGDCRFFQRSIWLWPVPSPSPATGIGSPTDYAQFTDLCYYGTVFHPLRGRCTLPAATPPLVFPSIFFKFRALSKPVGGSDAFFSRERISFRALLKKFRYVE